MSVIVVLIAHHNFLHQEGKLPSVKTHNDMLVNQLDVSHSWKKRLPQPFSAEENYTFQQLPNSQLPEQAHRAWIPLSGLFFKPFHLLSLV